MPKKTKNIIIIFITILAIFTLAHFVLAQELDVGLKYGEATGLGQEDPRLIMANIIRVILGFLGVIAVILIIYAGWLFMTAAGNAEKVDKAKKILIGAIIGLLICLSAFAVTSFILSKLLEATVGEGGGPYYQGSLTAGDGYGGSNGGSSLPSVGEPCLTDPLDVSCAAGECAPGLICGSGCLCEESDIPGEGESCDGDIETEGCQAIECANDLVCSASDDCLCIRTPLIAWVSPVDADGIPNGAPGNFITISGKYFGTVTGKVIFMGDPNNEADDIEALFPDSVNPNCTNNWQDRQIIVVVPQGAVSGPIKVIDANNLWDTTDNDRGPKINDFNVNDQRRPGLCLINPDSGYFEDDFNLQGASFNGTVQKVLFGSETSSTTANNISGWINTSVDAEVPNINQGKNTVFVNIDGISSNSLQFRVLYDLANKPIIEYIDPSQGPSGQYITIYGSNFKTYQAGSSLVHFYLPADPENLINADIDFPEECQSEWWHDTYIIVKVPQAELADYKVIVTNKDNYVSAPADFAITTGSPGPGLCLLDPHNGPVGQSVSAYGDNFGSTQGSGSAVFYSNQEGVISSWLDNQVNTNLPSGAQTGPFKIINNNGDVSNSLPFTVGSCLSNEECELSEECCGSGTYWAGICRSEGDCSEGSAIGCGYGWTFSTSPAQSKILSCSSYTTVEACIAADMCPNSPGQCQTRDSVAVGDCSDDYCNNIYSACANNCVYDSDLNKCKLSGFNCDEANTDLVPGYTAECRQVDGKGIWQINTGGVSCPSGTFLDINGWCTVGTLVEPETCNLCNSGFKCEDGECIIDNDICPENSTCQDDKCILDNPVCECCCRVGYDAQDCCAGLTCEPGNCGPGEPDYGLCTGCKVVIDGEVSQEASDQACSCYGQPTRYCELNYPDYPQGVCRDQSGQGESCDGDVTTAGCQANDSMCQPGLYCDQSSCTCQSGGGESGQQCINKGVSACSEGEDYCVSGYECLDNADVDCRCCCNPDNDQCADPLECWPNQSPCDSNNRGLCCGCSTDAQCNGGINSGCGLDTCCRARPTIKETFPIDNATNICRNALITATFDQEMDITSFAGNVIVVGDYGSDQCPEGTQYLALDGELFQKKNVFARVYYKTLRVFKKFLGSVAFLFGSSALAEVPQNHNYCAISGTVGGYNNAAGEGVLIFEPSQQLDANQIYYVILKGDNNIADNVGEGILSYYGIGMNGPDTETFNAHTFANAYIWSFETGSQICQLSYVAIEPSSYLFEAANGTQVFQAYAKAANGQDIVPIPGTYNWQWNWTSDDKTVATVTNSDNRQQIVTAQNKDDARTYIRATATISEDEVANPSTVGESETGKARVYVFLCENPWPPVKADGTWEPWSDNINNCSIVDAGCYDTNYEFYYCRDAGSVGTADDLPAILSEDTVIRGRSTTQNILKEFYFLREDMPSVTVLTVTDQQTGGKVAASWETVAGASGYKLYYGTSSGNYSNYLDVGNVTSRIVSDLTNGKIYYFAVTAYYETGAESNYSNEVSVIATDSTAPTVPDGLTAFAGNGQVELNWTANTDDTVGYKVYYGTAPGVYGASEDVGDATEVIIAGLTNGVTYYFTVTALDAYNNESAYSNEVSAMPIE